MDLRDREHAKRLNSLETNNKECLSRIESAVESLLQRAADTQHDERNSRPHQARPPSQTRSVKLKFPRFYDTFGRTQKSLPKHGSLLLQVADVFSDVAEPCDCVRGSDDEQGRTPVAVVGGSPDTRGLDGA
ncbi:hypothetical protein KIW84_010442 [Lathyrus oleraceus]|uniref:Uncharacterized protein n=1 Tax=Pisum sativum TaxID=3888 RepID=A0A9D5BBF9_PEA|nr:hypothetical protein KIW84_010442 [Pisum sativum]